MRNLKLEIEYDGSRYCGWQVQNIRKALLCRRAKRSIQGVVEKALRRILREKVKLTVAGRTDAGVHALAQVANFKTANKMPLPRMQWALNGLLPADITVSRIKQEAAGFNSRFSARSKVYRYTVLNRRYSSALSSGRAYFFHYPLDIRLMRKEARALLGKHNFKSLQAADSRERNPVKTLKSLKIRKQSGFLHIDIEADGFLYNMARNIAGTLLEIGRGRFSPGSMERILKSQDRRLAGPTLPAHGLCLMKVKY